jgi:DNA mismatch endonuclease (patch repair protein)
MTDIYSKEKRSNIMSKISGKNTKPELIIRRILRNLGIRYRLHKGDIPGKPDIVLKKYNKVIFIHGCFWHGHEGCKRSKRPETNKEFWNRKIDRNIERDKENEKQLYESGWDVIVIWQCQLKDLESLKLYLANWILNGGHE